MKRCLLAVVFAAAFCVPASGQFSLLTRDETGAMTFSGVVRSIPPALARAPFSAVEVFECVHALPHGSRKNCTLPSKKLFRDSDGRTRIEQAMGLSPDARPELGIVEIMDPVARQYLVLDVSRRVAYRTPLPPVRTLGERGNAPASPPNIQAESLGSRVIEGEVAFGSRLTTRFGAPGSERTSIVEMWNTPALRLDLLLKCTEPDGSEFTSRLENLTRREPARELFAVPADFKIVDGAPFTISAR